MSSAARVARGKGEKEVDTRTSKELNGLLELKEQLRKLLRKQCMKFI